MDKSNETYREFLSIPLSKYKHLTRTPLMSIFIVTESTETTKGHADGKEYEM